MVAGATVGPLAANTPLRAEQATVLSASGASREQVLSRPARLVVKDLPLSTAVERLAASSGVMIAYSPSLLPPDVRVSCACYAVPLEQALTTLLAGTGVSFRVVDRQIMLVPRAPGSTSSASVNRAMRFVASPSVVASTLAADLAPTLPQETITITGRVTSRALAPVAGAMVRLVGAQVSTTTNQGGVFRLVLDAGPTPGTDTVRVVRVGYRPWSGPVELKPGIVTVDVSLGEMAVELDEVLVTGTAGNMARRAQSAEVASLDAEAVTQTAPIANLQELLTARFPGVSVARSNGAVGGTSVIRIRGISSLALSNEPLIFVDGVRMDYRNVQVSGNTANISTLTDLNPNEIESIEVVKGPAAATLYGADASAGVIQVITKRGVIGSGRFQQTVSAEYAQVRPDWTPPENYARCGAAQVAPTSTSTLCRGQEVGTIVSDSPLLRESLLFNGTGKSLRWSGRGGGRDYGYFAGIGYGEESGVMPANGLKQFSSRVNFNFMPRSDLTVDAGFGLSRDMNSQTPQGDVGLTFMLALVGNPLTVGGPANGWLLPNMSTGLLNTTNEFGTTRMTPNIRVNYSPLPWFVNRLTIGADISRVNYRQFRPKNDGGWFSSAIHDSGYLEEARLGINTYTFDYLATLSRSMGSWKTDLSLGAQVIAQNSDQVTGTGWGFTSNLANTISGATTVTSSGTRSDQRSVGTIGQLQLGYRDRLFFQFGTRIDRHSAFGDAAGAFVLPKVGFSYVISDESAWQRSLGFINTLLVRAAYGTTGRSPASGAPLRTYVPQAYVGLTGASTSGVVLGNPGNAELKAERGEELEAGLEAAAFDDRIGVKLTYFDKTTRDLLLQRPLPPSMGYTQNPFANIGRVVNRGIETSLRATVLTHRNVGVEFEATLSTLHNRIESLGDVAPIRAGISGVSNFRVGDPMGAFYSQRVLRVDEGAGRAIVSDTGMYIGTPLPTKEGTFRADLALFRRLRVSGLAEWKAGFKKLDLTSFVRERQIPATERVLRQSELPPAERLRLFGPYVNESGAPVAASNIFDDYIQDGDFLRFRELTVTGDLSGRWFRSLGATSASVTVGIRNVALWTKYKGIDPESVTYVPTNGLFVGAEFNNVPQPQRLFTRINLAF